MTISYYDVDETAAPRPKVLLNFLMLVNTVIAMTVLFAWTAISLYIVEPVAWATWMPVRRGTTFEELFEYPFVLLWLMPVGGIIGAWIAARNGYRPLAMLLVLLPIVLLAMIFGWFHFAPAQYR